MGFGGCSYVLFLFMPQTNYIKGSVTIEAKWHINLFQICVKYIFWFFVTCFFFSSCDWTEVWEKILVKSCVLVLSLG